MKSEEAKTPPPDTIFALASGHGRAGVAVVRVSGPGSDDALQRLTKRALPAPRTAVLRTIFDLSNGDRIDLGLVLRFIAPDSYTGENITEYQVHGGRAVIGAVFENLSRLGLREAEPGEFTRRAVINGKLDLTQAEAIADLVNAETEAQRRQAFSQFDGRLSALYDDWRGRLIRAAAWIEAGIDFPDEEIPPESVVQSRAALAALADEMAGHLADGRRGEILRDGLHVAVIGPPNAGKSSLVNALAQRDVAIVSDLPGTTRDVIEVRLDLGGYPVILADTAGLRETAEGVEREGVRRALERAEAADVRVLVLDGSATTRDERPSADIVVWNKADLVEAAERSGGLWVSAHSGEGIAELVLALEGAARSRLATREVPAITRARHRVALAEAVAALRAALQTPAGQSELAAEHLRLALRALGRVTGRVDLDELLDVVFRDFCIGK